MSPVRRFVFACVALSFWAWPVMEYRRTGSLVVAGAAMGMEVIVTAIVLFLIARIGGRK